MAMETAPTATFTFTIVPISLKALKQGGQKTTL